MPCSFHPLSCCSVALTSCLPEMNAIWSQGGIFQGAVEYVLTHCWASWQVLAFLSGGWLNFSWEWSKRSYCALAGAPSFLHLSTCSPQLSKAVMVSPWVILRTKLWSLSSFSFQVSQSGSWDEQSSCCYYKYSLVVPDQQAQTSEQAQVLGSCFSLTFWHWHSWTFRIESS